MRADLPRIREAEFGNMADARRLAAAALALAPGQHVRLLAAAAFALAGDSSEARKLADQLNKDFPLDTLIQGFWLPTIGAAIELSHRGSDKAIDLLRAVARPSRHHS